MQLPKLLALPPHHLVHDARVGLDDLHDLGGHALVGVVGHELLESEPSASSATAVRAAQEAITVPKAANMLMKIERQSIPRTLLFTSVHSSHQMNGCE